MKRCLCLLALVLLAAALARAESRYMRYRLLAPAVPSTATLAVHAHNYGNPDYPLTWSGIEQPGVISNYGLFLAPNAWSRWRKLPDPPVWGDITLIVKSVQPLKAVKVEFQVSTSPNEAGLVRQFAEASETGSVVGFTLPPEGLLEMPRIETISETHLRRRRVAEAVAIPAYRRPKLLRFTGWGVSGHPTVKGSEDYELATTRLIGFNTFGQRTAGPYFHDGVAYCDESYIDTLKYTPDEVKRLAFLYIADEPGWPSGFNPMWERTKGNEGFRAWLKARGLDPALFGKATLDEVSHIRRDADASVPADAPLELRRLWYWSCRYTFDLDADYYAGITRKLEEKFPGAQSTVNYTDHQILLGAGLAVNNPDIFAWGRRRAVSMQMSEDWFAPGCNSWGEGLYQKLAFLVDIMRCAGRETTPPQTLAYHVVESGYDPYSPNTDATTTARVNLLLGRGVKTFSYFTWGPTTSGTTDMWGDNAPAVRGVADAERLLGGDHVEPFLWEGQPGPADVCLFYSIPAAFWQAQNKALDDNYEKQRLAVMLAQLHLQADVLDTTDLERHIDRYKVAYLVDLNLPAAGAARLRAWVQAGGVLVLWPQAATRDEYNSPLDAFPAAPGQAQLGAGWVVRFPERMAGQWWEKTKALNMPKTGRPVIFDDDYRDRVAAPVQELAKLQPAVTASARGIDVRALYSARGIAVPVVNMQYLIPAEHQAVKKVNGVDVVTGPAEARFPDGCVRYTREAPATVTLRGAADTVQVYSSRLGNLPFKKDGDTVTVAFPLDTTDVLIFAKTKVPVEKYPWSPPSPAKPKKG